MTQFDPNRRRPEQQTPLPLDYRNEPRQSTGRQVLRILMWLVIIGVVSIVVLFGVVAGACMCMR